MCGKCFKKSNKNNILRKTEAKNSLFIDIVIRKIGAEKTESSVKLCLSLRAVSSGIRMKVNKSFRMISIMAKFS